MTSSMIGKGSALPAPDARGGPDAATTGERARDRGLSIADHLTLFVIGLVVVLVSLPRLRRFAVRENENDAIQALRLLSADAADMPEVLGHGGLGALLAASTRHQNRLEDVEVLPDGRLRRHGYLLDAFEGEPGRWILRAWPWEHGRTGLGAFLASDATILGCVNADGEFSGPAFPPRLQTIDGGPADVDWRVLRR